MPARPRVYTLACREAGLPEAVLLEQAGGQQPQQQVRRDVRLAAAGEVLAVRRPAHLEATFEVGLGACCIETRYENNTCVHVSPIVEFD